jgi:hypothetical protein
VRIGEFGPLILTLGVLATAGVVAMVMLERQSALGHGDIVDYVTRARACVEHHNCLSEGEPSGISDSLHHGALWPRIVEWAWRSGSPIRRLWIVTWSGFMLANLTVFAIARRYQSKSASVAALWLHAVLALVGCGLASAEMLEVFPLPLALYWLAAALLAETGSAAAAACGGMAIAASASLDLSLGLLVPLHIMAAAALATRPTRGVASAVVGLVVPYALFSGDSFREIVHELGRIHPVLAVVAIGALALACFLGRRFCARIPSTQRVPLLMLVGAMYTPTGVLLGAIVLRQFPWPHYFASSIVPIAYLAAAAAVRLRSASRFVALGLACAGALALLVAPRTVILAHFLLLGLYAALAVAGALRSVKWAIAGARRREIDLPTSARPAVLFAVLLIPPLAVVPAAFVRCASEQEWSLAEAEQVVIRLYAQGVTFPQMVTAMQGANLDAILFMATLHAPETSALPIPRGHALTHNASSVSCAVPVVPSDSDRSMMALQAPRSAIAGAQGTLLSFPVDSAHDAAVVEAPAFIKKFEGRICVHDDAGGTPFCREMEPRAPRQYLPRYVKLGSGPDRRQWRGGGRVTVRYTLAVRTDGSGDAHTVHALPAWPLRWRIRKLTGVTFDDVEPGQEIRLRNARTEEGEIEIEGSSWRIGPHVFLGGLAPPYIEVDQANNRLLDPIRQLSAPLCGDVPETFELGMWLRFLEPPEGDGTDTTQP